MKVNIKRLSSIQICFNQRLLKWICMSSSVADLVKSQQLKGGKGSTLGNLIVIDNGAIQNLWCQSRFKNFYINLWTTSPEDNRLYEFIAFQSIPFLHGNALQPNGFRM